MQPRSLDNLGRRLQGYSSLAVGEGGIAVPSTTILPQCSLFLVPESLCGINKFKIPKLLKTNQTKLNLNYNNY
jgi:hypothetical protein